MNTSEHFDISDRDDERFDRLVDGELSPDEYRSFLSELDDEPGGWRRCAMAFLEAQALAKELGSTLQLSYPSFNPQAKALFDPSIPANHARRAPAMRILSLVAIAASFLAALALGIVAPRFFTIPSKEPSLAGNFNREAVNEPAPATGGVLHRTLRPIGNLRLMMDGYGGQTESAQVPVYEVGSDLQGALDAQPDGLSLELVDLLREYGYDVQHQQQLVPAPLDDGRQIIVPVDGYQITPIGRRY